MIDRHAEERTSKSQVKRDLMALQALGQQLVELPAKNLAQVPMAEVLRAAVLDAKRFKRGARRRQEQYIGALLREEDEGVIRAALAALRRPHHEEVEAFHEIEQWRDALLGGEEEPLDALCERFTGIDRQHLRQLVRNAQREQEQNKPPKSARALFRYLARVGSPGRI